MRKNNMIINPLPLDTEKLREWINAKPPEWLPSRSYNLDFLEYTMKKKIQKELKEFIEV